MTTNQDVNTPVIAVVGFLSVTLVFAIVVLLQVLYYQIDSRQSYEKDLAERPMELSKLVEAQQAQLAEYRWTDPQKKVVAIPINRAMDLVVREYGSHTKPTGGNAPSSDNAKRAKEHEDGP